MTSVKTQSTAHLGIIVGFQPNRQPPFSERGFFQFLSQYGRKKGVEVTVFCPTHTDWKTKHVTGYRYLNRRWHKGKYPLPLLIYDRIFYRSAQQIRRYKPAIDRLQQEEQVILLSRGLPGKWKVYEMLRKNEQLQPFLPETWPYSPSIVSKQIGHYQRLCLKPASGSHGKGVMKVEKNKRKLLVTGRDLLNQSFAKSFSQTDTGLSWLHQKCLNRPYVVQPYLTLLTKERVPFDMRILLQKNAQGKWHETGRAIRSGAAGGLTSNLHGGGRAEAAEAFLRKHFTAEQVASAEEQIKTILAHIAPQLEKEHGPLFELGIDIGLDQQANVWILEANSKPGRQSLQYCSNRQAYLAAATAPLHYAQYMSCQAKGAS